MIINIMVSVLSGFVLLTCLGIISHTFSDEYLIKNGNLAFWDSYILVFPSCISLIVLMYNIVGIVDKFDEKTIHSLGQIFKALYYLTFASGIAVFIAYVFMPCHTKDSGVRSIDKVN